MRHQHLTGKLLCLVLIGMAPSPAEAQAFVEQVSPPIVRRGVTNRIMLKGQETDHAVGLWTSLPDKTVRASVVRSTPSDATLDVTVTPEAPLGVYGLRLATRDGLSNLHLFVVDELPVQERDPAIPEKTVVPVTLPVTVTGTCRPAMVDRYSFTVGSAQRVSFEVVGSRLGQDFDPLIIVRDSTGRSVAEYDNCPGLMFDCRVAHEFNRAGTYTVEIRDARFHGNAAWSYALRMGEFPVVRVAVPSSFRPGLPQTLTFPQEPNWEFALNIPGEASGDRFVDVRQTPAGLATWIPICVTDLPIEMDREPNNESASATAVSVPAAISGMFDKPNDRDSFSFPLVKDQEISIQGLARSLGSAADLELVLFDPEGREVRRVDDTDSDEGGLTYRASREGLHRLLVSEVSRQGGPEFTYRIDVTRGGPNFTLSSDFSDLTLPAGSAQSLPLKVARFDYSGEIMLELKGGPTGLRIEPPVIPAGTTEHLARVTIPADAPAGLFSIQVVGTASPESGPSLRATAQTRPLVDRQLKNVDLIPYGLRIDQRQLPPSVQRQLAVMITPPVPFVVELPEPVLALTRFQTADLTIATSRTAGMEAPITFSVKGGQIGDEREERNQIYARFQPGLSDRLNPVGTFFNRINTQLTRTRADLTATAEIDGRRINLVRSFTLETRSAFRPECVPAQPAGRPGETIAVRLAANRVPTFNGPVTVALTPQSGLTFPSTVEIPSGQESAPLEIRIAESLNPGRHQIRMEAAGFVGQYEESLNLPNLTIEVQKPVP